jgi:hypothetical protein
MVRDRKLSPLCPFHKGKTSQVCVCVSSEAWVSQSPFLFYAQLLSFWLLPFMHNYVKFP